MDYENKYNEALERAREWYAANTNEGYRGIFEEIFPELNETDDEKIRKEILDYIIKGSESYYDIQQYGKEKFEKWITWLEKQKPLENYDEAEKEKIDFVGNGFVKCHADFLDFKEGNTYWLEYIGDDKYNVRSDNLLGKTYHITPCQLYTVFKKLTWLEKQGKKSQGKSALEAIKEEKVNNANKVEPKFHEGDYIVDINCGKVLHISEILTEGYSFENGSYSTFDNTNKRYRLWNIKDAKDGDVIWYKDEISLYKHAIINCTKGITFGGFVYHCCYDGKRFITDSLYSLAEQDKMDIHPATTEQRNILFQKMKEAGYEWDTDKKKLKKLN